MNTKTLLSIYLFFILILVQTLFASDQKSDTYNIAIIIPLSGNVASMGQYVKQGIDLAYEELNPAKKNRIKLIYEDDQFINAKTVSAYRNLTARHDISAVIVIGSPPANALSPLVEKDAKILIAVGASDPSIAKDKKYSFIHWVKPEVLGLKLAEHIAKYDYKKLALIAAEASGAIADINGLESALKDKGLADRIVYKETRLPDATDYRSDLMKIQKLESDAIVAVLFPGALSSFAKQIKEYKIKATLLGMETFEDEAEIKASRGALDEKFYVNASNANQKFSESFKKSYGIQPGWASSNGYDTIKLLAQAVMTHGNDNLKITQYLNTVKDFDGACGIYSSSGDNRFLLPAQMKQVRGESFVVVE